ncbi:MAG: primosomal protein N' (replication factor Y) - superfamily II helicase [Pseudomonadota bacterium]
MARPTPPPMDPETLPRAGADRPRNEPEPEEAGVAAPAPDDEVVEDESSDPTQFPCAKCGALLKFQPGAAAIVCDYCGHENPIAENHDTVEELDFEAALAANADSGETIEVQTVQCDNCGAAFTLDPEVHSDACPFCGTDVVAKPQTHKLLRPRSVLPFGIDGRQARQEFRKWVGRLWFAPNKLKQYARADDAFAGMYVPHWTYDSQTHSSYTGMRGTYYYVPQTYTTTVNGKSVTRTRMVRKIRWRPASGRVSRFFDDVLVLADNKLPRKYADKLEPWDLHNLASYDERYLAGFRAETYNIDVRDGFGIAQQQMDKVIRGDVRRDIGGDVQRITGLSTRHQDVTYKHILLPVWLGAYRFNNKTYNVLVNGRTGEVQGERPWSWIKIGAAVLAGLAIAAAIYFGYEAFADGGDGGFGNQPVIEAPAASDDK